MNDKPDAILEKFFLFFIFFGGGMGSHKSKNLFYSPAALAGL